MVTVLMFALSIALLSVAFVALALHQEYLVVLHWRRVAVVFLVRGEKARYHQVTPWQLPMVVARFAASTLAQVLGAGRRIAVRIGNHLPHPVSSKA